MLLVPSFVLFLGLHQRLAHGSALLTNSFLATSGVLIYILDGSVNWVAASLVFAGSFWGVIIGTWLLQKINLRILLFAFIVLMLVAAVRLVLGNNEVGEGYDFRFSVAVAFVLMGLAVGILSGLLGIGGGIIMVPVFIVLLGFPAVVAKGTALLVIIPTTLTGAYRNSRFENLNAKVGVAAGLGGIPMALLGAWISSWISESLAQILFGVLLLVIASRMLSRAFKRPDPPDEPKPENLEADDTNMVASADDLDAAVPADDTGAAASSDDMNAAASADQLKENLQT